jgi:hypothetical protein
MARNSQRTTELLYRDAMGTDELSSVAPPFD